MGQTTEPIELPLKALRLESLTLLRDLLSLSPCCREGRIHEHKPASTVDRSQIRATA
ncbi:hypothetical protein QUB33_25965 [Microcoleus sp. B3-A4]|uniref:hypothetical protein n=1 Tax=Microcoleus sp. B3-A4 TaxID=2818653 RepID=UPI002FD32453